MAKEPRPHRTVNLDDVAKKAGALSKDLVKLEKSAESTGKPKRKREDFSQAAARIVREATEKD